MRILHDAQTGIARALTAVKTVTFAGDWHADPNAAIQAFEAARQANADVVVQVGDIVGTGEQFRRMTRACEAAVERSGIPLLFIRGNQDDPEMLATLPREPGTPFLRAGDGVFHAPNGASWMVGERTFASLGGASSPDRAMRTHGVDWWEDEMPTMEDVRRIVATAPSLDVLLSHDAPLMERLAARRPRRPAIWDEGYEEASGAFVAQAMWATAPKLLVAGHRHTRFSETVHRMSGRTQVEVLDQGDGHGLGALLDNVMTIRLDDKLLL